jgi:hypothetical protein
MSFFPRLAGVLLMSGIAWAQDSVSSFENLPGRVQSGDTLSVTDATGTRIQGRLVNVSATSLELSYRGARRAFTIADIREIRRREPDGRWNGALIGLAAGSGAGLLSIPVTCGTNDKECGAIVGLLFVPIGAAIGTVTGAMIDGRMAKSTLLYRGPASTPRAALSLAPLVGRRSRGFALTVRF